MSIDRRKCYSRTPQCMFIFICLTLLTSLTVLSQDSSEDEDNSPSLELVRAWAENISESIIEQLDSAAAFQTLKTAYETSGFEEHRIDGTELLQQVAEKWEKMLQLKMTAVEKIVQVLEESYRNYTYNPAITLDNVTFVNSKNFSKDNISVGYEELFLSDVNLNFSSIQIPTDIYEGDPEILNSILASDRVDKVFVENAKEDPELIWQYFGSAKGFYRSYPAKQWVSSAVFDQYDVRRRGWYIQATSSPKNILILIDVSGSTFGMTLEVIKVSVSKALDTLGNDDYVMVAKFNDSCENIVSCEGFQTFVQANLRNKEVVITLDLPMRFASVDRFAKHLKQKVQQLEAGGQVDFEKALSFGFEQFKKFESIEEEGEARKNVGANCIRAIMIFTDGGRDMGREILERENRRKGEPWVRIFVYNVGTDSMVPSDGVKQMACDNKGFFSNIRSFGAVRLTTLDYVPVLSRPMVLSNQKNFQWSDIYLDALGLGMMTTLTYPVYNQSKDGTPSEELLGVVGTDITTKNMAETVPQRKIGPEGYTFGINTNGYILLHPRLKAELGGQGGSSGITLGYLSEPPNVDFLEVEFADDNKTKLRRDMINGKTGSETFLTFVMSKDERYVEEVEMTYSYTFINNTTFSVALAQPFFDLIQFTPNISDRLTEAVSSLDPEGNKGQILIASWVFCESLNSSNVTSQEIFVFIRDQEFSKCDIDMLYKLLGDALVTDNWTDSINVSKISDSSLVKGVFLATQGGLSRFFPKDYLQTEEEKKQRQDPWDQDYYRRPLYKENTYVFSVPYNNGSGTGADSNLTITVSKAVHIKRLNTPAVVGAFLRADVFDSFWKNRTRQANNNFEKEFCYSTSDRPHCYLLDDGGFIIATSLESDHTSGSGNEKSNVGRFFGEVDGRIMRDLLRNQVFRNKTSFDYQAACPYITPTASAGPRMAFVPSITDILNFSTWLASAAWTLFTHTLYDLFIFGVSPPTFIEAQATEEAKNVSCIKLQTQYYFGEKMSERNVEYCSGRDRRECERKWFSARVQGTNLLLLQVSAKCGKDVCEDVIVKQVPRDPDPEDIDPCKDAAEPRYRKRPPEQCYDFHKNESSRCTNGASILSSGPLCFILFLLFLASHDFSF